MMNGLIIQYIQNIILMEDQKVVTVRTLYYFLYNIVKVCVAYIVWYIKIPVPFEETNVHYYDSIFLIL